MDENNDHISQDKPQNEPQNEQKTRPPLLQLRGICKSFGPVRALHEVDLTLNHNEVLGLVGDNAAGKSTLMKMITGAYQPDKGQIFFEGTPVKFRSPHDSRAMGVEMVYQDFALAGNLDITSNIFLGKEEEISPILNFISGIEEAGIHGLRQMATVLPDMGLIRFLRDAEMIRRSRDHISRLKINVQSVNLKVQNLSGGQRQAVAIGRATAFNAKVVIMDEPTASLAVKEVGKVLELIKGLREHDVSVIVISHRLQDIFEVSDRIMVLKQGQRVGDKPTRETNMDEIVALMVGARDDFAEAHEVAVAG